MGTNGVEAIADAWSALREQLDHEFTCEHEYRALRCFVASNGAQQYRMQCLHCGNGVEVVKKYVALSENRTILPWDESLRESWWRKRSERYRELVGQIHARQEDERREKNSEWWTWYNRYLSSPAWYRRRQKVLKRANFVCEACGERPAIQAHHLTYKHVGQEPLFELVAVCKECHELLHDGPSR